MDGNGLLTKIADVGWEGPGEDEGRDCIPYTENEDESHRIFRAEAEALKAEALQKGLSVKIQEDPFFNSYVTLEGYSPRKVAICSHLDSVPHGGRYDGVLGVASGLDILKKFIDDGEIPNISVQVIAFRSEESSVTGKSCLGSRLATGNYEVDELRGLMHRVLDKSIYEILEDRGTNGQELDDYSRTPFINHELLHAVIEFHVEQSGVLDSCDVPFGIVIHGVGGARRSKVLIESLDGKNCEIKNGKILKGTVRGTAGHSGGTPMNGEIIGGNVTRLRKDALLAVSKFLQKLNVRGLVSISVPDGSYNVIPALCEFELCVPGDRDVGFFENVLQQVLEDGMSASVEFLSKENVDIECIRENVSAAAMDVICDCESIVGKTAVETNGQVRATIGNIVKTERGITLLMDQRRLNNDVADVVAESVCDRLNVLMQMHDGVDIHEEDVGTSLATSFIGPLQNLMRRIYSETYGSVPIEMGSMPGHDISSLISSTMDGAVPGGMVFVRGRNGGISHHPSEYSSEEDIAAAKDFLFKVVKSIVMSGEPKAFPRTGRKSA
ncbi:MAG: M20/M25/M40 family metallo-hydrolase [Candidatus Peregrinibacteria bacterium]